MIVVMWKYLKQITFVLKKIIQLFRYELTVIFRYILHLQNKFYNT